MASLLKGVAYITGAGSGIGQYTAWAFARHGVKCLAVTDVNPSALRTTVDELKRRHSDVEVKAIEMDVSQEQSIEDSIRDTVSAFGRIDIAVNNAGIGGPAKTTPNVTRSEWQTLLDINLTGVWLCQKAQIRQMLKQESQGLREGRGTIINTASMLGIVGSSPATPATAYTASKHGVMGLTKTDAIQFAADGIRINAICPGYIGTPLLKSAAAAGVMEKEIEKVPMRRLGEMEEIADSIVFLASPMSSFMTGAGLIVDGGYTCQ